MALDTDQLEGLLLNMFDNPTSTFTAAGEAWADMYEPYAENADSCGGGNPESLDAAKETMAGVLTTAFAGSNNQVDTANAIASAMTAFWLIPPVPFDSTAPASPGVVTAVTGSAVLITDLLALWAVQNPMTNPVTAEESAEAHAPIFDKFTKTVVVTHVLPGPSSCALPIV